VAYHPNEHWPSEQVIEDPNQFIGGFVALPAAFTSIGSQLTMARKAGRRTPSQTFYPRSPTTTSSRTDTFTPKLRVYSPARTLQQCPLGSTSFKTHTTVGGGGQIAANYELVRDKLVLLANGFWSDGGAHYLVAKDRNW